MFTLNTQSGMLHMDEHGGGANAEEFDRADAADKFMHDMGKRMTFCKTCFADNRNVEVAEDLAAREAELAPSDDKATGSPTESTTARGTLPPRITDPTADGKA